MNELHPRILVETVFIVKSYPDELKQASSLIYRYLKEMGIKVAYLHSEIKALQRLEIIRKLRKGVYDCIVGINLLREGLDIPEVSLICILDADKEGFLRSERSLIQTIGRAARNANGKVVMYADNVTDSMQKAITETYRRREKQMKYNEEHGNTPETIKKDVREILEISSKDNVQEKIAKKRFSANEKSQLIDKLTKEMRAAAKLLEFEHAAYLRDQIEKIKNS